MTSRRDVLKFSVLSALMARFPQVYAQSSGGLTPAQYWQLQAPLRPTTRPVAPAPTIYVDAIHGDDKWAGTTMASALKTLSMAASKTLNPGAVIALANGSVFELTDAVVFRNVNGTASSRIYLTNYDPGGVPDTLPKIRYRFKPAATDWVWDASRAAWYFAHPHGRKFNYAYVRFNDDSWGVSYTYNQDYAALTAPYRYVSDQVNHRIYIYAPEGVNPTTYYNGVTIAGDDFGCLLMLRCGSYVTIENIDFEETPHLVSIGSYDVIGSNITGFELRNCHGVNVTGLMGTYADNHAYTVQVNVHDCSLQHYATAGVQLGNNSRDCVIEDNWFVDGGKCCTSAGAVYLQERPTTSAAINGTVVRRNFVDTYANGIGDHPYDGAGIYCEINSDKCLIQNNIVINCRTALQDNSGKSNSFVGNLLHCDRALMVTDQGNAKTTNLVFDGNTIYSQTGRNTYASPGAASSSDGVIAWRIDVADPRYALKARGNVIRAGGFSGRQAVFLIGTYDGSALPVLDLHGNTVSNVPFALPSSITQPSDTQLLDLEALATSSYTVPGITTIGASGSISSKALLGAALTSDSIRGAIGT
ncbi:hypothetical protein [Duganella sp. LjRoot269]|uniref:hypothetical protein n=1 Tax=Duganella sp. LjRoot269 TaxID=3342305 RepID=UPI003ED036F7